MLAIDRLKAEHQVIERMLSVFEEALDRLDLERDVRIELLEESSAFFIGYVDKYHYEKEEQVLFARMQAQASTFQNGPIEVMLAEHGTGRFLTQALGEAIGQIRSEHPNGKQSLVETGRKYISFLHEHIAKENHVLYPIAEHILTGDQQEQVLAGFREVEAMGLPEPELLKFTSLAQVLEQELVDSDSFALR